MIKIFPINALKDNYIWALCNTSTKQVAIVDPGVAAPVIKCLAEQDLQLSSILVTHHHADHNGGVEELLQHSPVPVFSFATIGTAAEIDLPDQHLKLKVMHIPGHTMDHIAFYNNKLLFSGDTLFGAGCGRIAAATVALAKKSNAQQMFESLNKLKNLPPETKVYCGHEYTLANLKFAATIEPDNAEIKQRITQVEQLLAQNLPSLPSTIGLELATNPFLRVATLEKFAQIRSLKDNF
jgi:hydroxyacylglutathione hydrolase